MKRILWTLFFAVALLALGTAVVAALNLRGEAALPAESQALSQAVPATPELVARVVDRKSTRLNSSHSRKSRMPSSA